MKKLVIFGILGGIIILGILGYIYFSGGEESVGEDEQEPRVIEIQNQNISGEITKDQIWSGKIYVTGDISVNPEVTLTILPGTIIKVGLTDDQNHAFGNGQPITDIYFPKDPPLYEKEKITIHIGGTLNAVGTPDNKIIFTSESENPTTYDWH